MGFAIFASRLPCFRRNSSDFSHLCSPVYIDLMLILPHIGVGAKGASHHSIGEANALDGNNNNTGEFPAKAG